MNKVVKSWFKKHPKNAIFLFCVIFITVAAFACENLLALISNNIPDHQLIQSSIRLKEFFQSLSVINIPSDEYLKTTDSLIKDKYVFRTDENGFIIPSKINKKPDVLRVFLGGSTTECRYINEDNRFIYLIGRIIEDKLGLKIISYNNSEEYFNIIEVVNSWFENNPKKTIFIVCIIFILVTAIACEIFLSLINNNIPYRQIIQRFIRLREHFSSTSEIRTPSDEYLKTTDSLIKDKYVFRTDENGFIIPSKISYKNPDVSMVFLGGSTTECRFVNEDNRFTYLIGQIVREDKLGLKINSYNSGVAGNNSFHSINILLNKIIPIKPDFVIMMHNFNDLVILIYEGSYWNNNPKRSPIINIPQCKDFSQYSIKEKMVIMFPHLYKGYLDTSNLNYIKQVSMNLPI